MGVEPSRVETRPRKYDCGQAGGGERSGGGDRPPRGPRADSVLRTSVSLSFRAADDATPPPGPASPSACGPRLRPRPRPARPLLCSPLCTKPWSARPRAASRRASPKSAKTGRAPSEAQSADAALGARDAPGPLEARSEQGLESRTAVSGRGHRREKPGMRFFWAAPDTVRLASAMRGQPRVGDGAARAPRWVRKRGDLDEQSRGTRRNGGHVQPGAAPAFTRRTVTYFSGGVRDSHPHCTPEDARMS